MSKSYPNYQNKSYFDYMQLVKNNENFLHKINVTKPIVDDQCPKSFNPMKTNRKCQKYYRFLGKIFIFCKL